MDGISSPRTPFNQKNMDARLTIAITLWGLLACAGYHSVFLKGESSHAKWVRSLSFFMAIFAVALPVWRFRSLQYNGEINVDESGILAQAMRYLDDPVPWRSVNGGSGGPLNTWILFWAPLVGLKFTYLVARITGLACTALTILGTALGVYELVGSRLALLLCLPMTLLFCGTLNLDFVHFSSEQLPSAVCACVVWLILLQTRHLSLLRAFVVGVLTGALPFTKLQVAPAGVLLFVSALVVAISSSADRSTKIRAGLLLAVGGLIVPTAILAPVALCGAWADFLEFYLMEGLRYKNTVSAATPSALQFLLHGSADFKTYWTAFCTLAIVGFCVRLAWFREDSPSENKRWIAAVGGFTAYLLVMTHLATRTGMGFPHYLILLIAPVTYWAAACLAGPSCSAAQLGETQRANHSAQRHRLLLSGGIGVVLVLQSVTFVALYRTAPQFVGNWGNPVHPLVPLILQHSSPEDRMFVWGWAPKFHVLTGIPPATRFASNGLMTGSGVFPELYAKRIKEDLEKSKPRLILDATEEFRWPTWPPGFLAGHQAVPELAAITFRDYRQVKRLDIKPGGQPFIIFERK
jgi:hypothetical protein